MQYKNLVAALIAQGMFLINGTVFAAEKDIVVQSTPVSMGIEAKSGNIIVGKVITPKETKKRQEAEAKKRRKAEKKKNKQPETAAGAVLKQDKKESVPTDKVDKTLNGTKELQKNAAGKYVFAGVELPDDYRTVTIYGSAVATKAQAVALIKSNNPEPKLSCSVEKLVDFYWEEAEREGVRPDLALAQSILETGSYRYGGDVHHSQNNFCGLGTTGGGVKGAKFSDARTGVRAHIQHLLAYAQQKRPSTPIVDPRYELAHNIRLERGVVDTWYGLNGTWAMGSLYCEKIMAHHQKMLAIPRETTADLQSGRQQAEQNGGKIKSVKERVEEILKNKR